MRIALALSLFLPITAPTARSTAETAFARDASHVGRLAGHLLAGEVLVVRGIRLEDDRVVLETEDVLAGPCAARGFVVTLARRSPTAWQLVEPDLEQYLNGVTLARWLCTPQQIAAEFARAPEGARRRYAFRWSAAVEPWSTVRRRRPDLPEITPAGWRVRIIRYAPRPSAP